MKKLIPLLVASIMAISLVFTIPSYASNIDEQTKTEVPTKPLEQGEIAQVLAPIALYPDSLLTHILIASTYPIEVIEAQRWAEKNPDINHDEIEQQVATFNWDPSVVALIAFPTILEKMSTQLSWTQQLGDAFLQDEEQVLATIQTLRAQAQQAGNLDKMENVKVIKEKETIIIEPAEKEVVYVPYYDTRVVYGGWHWTHYPPVYWHYPPHYAVYHHHSPFYWHSGVHISFNFFFSSFHWHNHHVVISHHHHRPPHHRPHPGYKRSVSHGGYANATRWQHNPTHRRGVAYQSTTLSRKYHSSRPSRDYSKTVRIQEKQFTNRNAATTTTTAVTRHQKLNQKMTKTTHVTNEARNKRPQHSTKPANRHSVKSEKERVSPSKPQQKATHEREQYVKQPKSSNNDYHKNKSNKQPAKSAPRKSGNNYSAQQHKRYASANASKHAPSSKGGSRRHHQ
ncbi:DUF3300 domain-containing protein [Thalassotalea sp. LPB0316]|uniref:DUF3300 domain-containing protein n=1 Tax=Thalassotalea sp. LPB0316 TaxID=2769490 RepID=UPI00186615B8|nr:DUF3300 domain-containing protein [Thalassotalea sp. LPB0316]QOL26367.1 DUF3300 domain-containing protein [Thalassotalea sp. LPB0316]